MKTSQGSGSSLKALIVTDTMVQIACITIINHIAEVYLKRIFVLVQAPLVWRIIGFYMNIGDPCDEALNALKMRQSGRGFALNANP